jgi:hypothetical protein
VSQVDCPSVRLVRPLSQAATRGFGASSAGPAALPSLVGALQRDAVHLGAGELLEGLTGAPHGSCAAALYEALESASSFSCRYLLRRASSACIRRRRPSSAAREPCCLSSRHLWCRAAGCWGRLAPSQHVGHSACPQAVALGWTTHIAPMAGCGLPASALLRRASLTSLGGDGSGEAQQLWPSANSSLSHSTRQPPCSALVCSLSSSLERRAILLATNTTPYYPA